MINLTYQLSDYHVYDRALIKRLTDLQLRDNYLAINDFRQAMPGYYGSFLDYNLKPDTLFNILKNVSGDIIFSQSVH